MVSPIHSDQEAHALGLQLAHGMAQGEEAAFATFADVAGMLDPELTRKIIKSALKSRGDAFASRYMRVLGGVTTQSDQSVLGHAVYGIFESRLIAMLDAEVKATGAGKRLLMSAALRGAFDRFEQHVQLKRTTSKADRVGSWKCNVFQRAKDLGGAVWSRLPGARQNQ